MVCYRAETSLLNLLFPHFSRAIDEGRAFLKALFELPADIVPHDKTGTLAVYFHSMANPRSNKALKDLCDIMNREASQYLQTRLKMVFEAPPVAFELTPGQEF